MLQIRNVQEKDLPALVTIEHESFSPLEAATEDAFRQRIKTISDSFFVAEIEGKVVGLINGPVIVHHLITDDLFTSIQPNPSLGGHQSILGLAVLPAYRKHGVATALLTHMEEKSKNSARETVTLTCKEDLIAFYEKRGYQNFGQSASVHGNVIWYDMVKKLL